MSVLKRFPELVAAIWACAFTYLLFSGKYIYFLSPGFSYLLIIGILLSMVLFLGGLLARRDSADPLLVFTNSLLLLLPIFFLISGTNFELGGYAFSKKRTSFMDSNIGITPKTRLPQEMSKGKYYKIPLNFLASPFKNFNDEFVETVGQIHRSQNQKYLALFRFVITCCAADARPVGVILPLNEKTGHLKNNDWAIIRGKFLQDEYKGKTIRQMRPEEVEKIDPPPLRERYLY